MKAVIVATLAIVLASGQMAGAADRFGAGVVVAIDQDAGTLLIEGVARLQRLFVDPMAAIHDWKRRELAFADIAVGDVVDYETRWLGGVEIAVTVRVMPMTSVAALNGDEP